MTQKRLKSQKTIKAISIDAILLREKQEMTRAMSEIMPILEDLFEKSENEAFDLIGVGLEGDATTPAASSMLKKEVIQSSKSATATTNLLIQSQLMEAIRANETLYEMTNRVEDVFEGAKRSRAELIARTESARVNGAATEQAFIDSGVVEAKEWVTEAGACEFCAALEGATAPLGGNFYDKGETLTGVDGGKITFEFNELPYQPVHPNCRCSIAPILIDVDKNQT